MPERRGRIQCLDRALDVLEAIAAEGELTAPQLAARLGLNSSTVHNIASTLAARAYLVGEAGRYRIGPGAALLAGAWDPLVVLPRIAMPYLDAVVAGTGESAVLTVLLGDSALMVACVLGPGEVTAQFPRRDYPFPLTIATGRVMVAHGEKSRWPHIIACHRTSGPAAGDEAPWTADHWEEELRAICESGLAESCRPGGVYAVGVPVRGPRGAAVIASLGVSCPSFRADEEHRAAMRSAAIRSAQELSASLAAPD